MEIHITIKDLYDSKFRFYLKDSFRSYLFNKLKRKYKNWEIISKKLGMNPRQLFGIRRGWEPIKGKKCKRMISGRYLRKIKTLTGINDKEIEKNIEVIKNGFGGLQARISLPLGLFTEKTKVNSLGAALLDYKLRYILERRLEDKLHKDFTKTKNYLKIKPIIDKKYIKELRKRGLNPNYRIKDSNISISYRVPGSNSRKEAIIPKRIIFDEVFSKQFGKWRGDRCGGKRKIGVANKEWSYIKEFNKFLNNNLNQKNVVIYLTCKKGFKVPKSLSQKVDDVKYSKTQYGEYAYRTEVSNAILKRLVFDKFEDHLFSILYNSKKSVRSAFYAGLFEAEGSISKKSKILSFSFGLNLKKGKENQEILETYKKAIELNFLLNKDKFNSRISRKCANTRKSKIIKYDVNLLNSKTTRSKEVRFIKRTFLPYISHKGKLNTFREVFNI